LTVTSSSVMPVNFVYDFSHSRVQASSKGNLKCIFLKFPGASLKHRVWLMNITVNVSKRARKAQEGLENKVRTISEKRSHQMVKST